LIAREVAAIDLNRHGRSVNGLYLKDFVVIPRISLDDSSILPVVLVPNS
jgi:hypothetical protein